MSVTLERPREIQAPALATTLRNAGIAGAGGAGFPTHAKWARLDEVDHLLVNHQESEPNYYIDKWLGRERADELASLVDALLEEALETVVIAAKETNRDRWMGPLEDATGGTVYEPGDLPLDPDEASGVVFAYTDDKYQYGMESVLMRIVADTVIGDGLPMDHGWIVQNTETLFNVFRTLEASEPVTRKLLHVDGNVPTHRFLDVPVGMPADQALEAAGLEGGELQDDQLLLDGGPGWCFEIDRSPEEFGVRKRTNCLLVVDEKTAFEHTYGGERVNLLEPYNWRGDHETEPTAVEPDRAVVPLITNPSFEGIVEPADPIVRPGDTVEAGEVIATPAGDISISHHASIDGTVADVSSNGIVIEADDTPVRETAGSIDREIYWTWCVDCGDYLSMPDAAVKLGPTTYRCQECA